MPHHMCMCSLLRVYSVAFVRQVTILDANVVQNVKTISCVF